jgi:hypothetical protein
LQSCALLHYPSYCSTAFYFQLTATRIAARRCLSLHAPALRQLPRPGHDSSARCMRNKVIAQVLPPYMIEHDEMVARQRRKKEEAARLSARSVRLQREQVAAGKTRK